MVVRPLTPGIYAPLPTFFHKGSEDLDLETFKKHVVHIASTGVGILVCGSMAEAHHLDREERVHLIKAAREALDGANFTTTPIIAGTAIGSTRGTIEITIEAANAGADYAIVIPSGYYAGALDRAALKEFFSDVSQASPIPIMVYNYPGASGGIDMDSDLIEEMAREMPNLCGVKLTCGNVGKLTRIAATVSSPSFTKDHPRKVQEAPYLVLGGFADFLLPSRYANAHGAITGLANVAPNALHRLWKLAELSVTDSSVLAEAQQLQGIIARADRTIAVTGIAGTKWLLQKTRSYGGVTRLPLLPTTEEAGNKLWAHPHVVDLFRVEKELSSGGQLSTALKESAKRPVVATAETSSSEGEPVTPSPKSSISSAKGHTVAKPTHAKTASSGGWKSLFGSIKRSVGTTR